MVVLPSIYKKQWERWVISCKRKEKSDTESYSFAEFVKNNRYEPEAKARMINAPDITLLTANQLSENLIMYKSLWDEYFHHIFVDKSEFNVKMITLRNIRNSVAHNRSISFSWIDDLENIHRWLLEKIGRNAVKQLKNIKENNE